MSSLEKTDAQLTQARADARRLASLQRRTCSASSWPSTGSWPTEKLKALVGLEARVDEAIRAERAERAQILAPEAGGPDAS